MWKSPIWIELALFFEPKANKLTKKKTIKKTQTQKKTTLYPTKSNACYLVLQVFVVQCWAPQFVMLNFSVRNSKFTTAISSCSCNAFWVSELFCNYKIKEVRDCKFRAVIASASP